MSIARKRLLGGTSSITINGITYVPSQATGNINIENFGVSSINGQTGDIVLSNGYDSRPDWDRAIDIQMATNSTIAASAILRITGDGWLFVHGCVAADHDIQVFGACSIEAATLTLSGTTGRIDPYAADRIFLSGCNGNGNDQGALMIYINADHPLFIYALGNDKANWSTAFIPSKSNTTASPITQITDITITRLRGYNAFAKVNQRIRSKNGSTFSLVRPNFPIDKNDPLNYLGLSTTTCGITHTHTMTTGTLQNFKLVRVSQYTVNTMKVNRYWFTGNDKNYSSTSANWNYRRVKTAGANPVYEAEVTGTDLIIFEHNTVTNKWRAVYVYNWLERANDDYSYKAAKPYVNWVCSKLCICEKKTLTSADIGKYRRYNESTAWRIDGLTTDPSNANNFIISYTPYTFGGSKSTASSIIQGTPNQTAIAKSTLCIIYDYNENNNPHPFSYVYNSRRGFETTTHVGPDGKTYVCYGWKFGTVYTLISPELEWNPRCTFQNDQFMASPSEFAEMLQFNGNWTMYRDQNLHSSSGHGCWSSYTSIHWYFTNTTTGFNDHRTTVDTTTNDWWINYGSTISSIPLEITYGEHLTGMINLPEETPDDTDTPTAD